MFALASFIYLACSGVYEIDALTTTETRIQARSAEETTINIFHQGSEYRTFILPSTPVSFQVEIEGRLQTRERSVGICVTTDAPIVKFRADADLIVLVVPSARCTYGAYTYSGGREIIQQHPFVSNTQTELTSFCLFSPSLSSQLTEVEAEIDRMYGQSEVYIHTAQQSYGVAGRESVELRQKLASFYVEYVNQGQGSELEYHVTYEEERNNFTEDCSKGYIDYIPSLTTVPPWDFSQHTDKCMAIEEDVLEAIVVIVVIIVLLAIFIPLIMIVCGCCCCKACTTCKWYGCLRRWRIQYNAPFNDSLMSDDYKPSASGYQQSGGQAVPAYQSPPAGYAPKGASVLL